VWKLADKAIIALGLTERIVPEPPKDMVTAQ
jgi:hypothetical protein